MRPVVKICGLVRPADARFAARLGASFVGCVMAKDSPRHATGGQARAVFGAAAGAVPVLVFRGASAAEVMATARGAGVDHVQVHGLTPADARQLEEAGFVVMRAYAVAESATALPALTPAPSAERPAILDTGGGTGRRFDWDLLGQRAPAGVLIAGGVRPENLAELLPRQPWGIDLSSGVESAPGVKSHRRLEQLFAVLEDLS